MKKLLLLPAVFLLLSGFFSCKKVITAIFPGIDARVPDIHISVPPILIVPQDEVSLGTYTVDFNMDSVIRANTSGIFNAGDIASVKIKAITINLQNADNLNNLSNMEYARLSLISPEHDSELPVTTIHFPNQTSSTQTTEVNNSPELRNILQQSQLHYSLSGKMRRTTTKTLNMVVQVTLRIE